MLNEFSNLFGKKHIVGIHQDDDLTCALCICRIEGRRLTAILFEDESNSLIARCPLLDNGAGVIA
jgi:hypothetical protein